MELKIIGLPKKCRWKECLTCDCKGKLDKCLHCKYTEAENSIPKESFNITVYDKNNKQKILTINKIKIVIGRHDDVIGWSF